MYYLLLILISVFQPFLFVQHIWVQKKMFILPTLNVEQDIVSLLTLSISGAWNFKTIRTSSTKF